MMSLLNDKKKAIIALLCGFTFIIGIICTEKVKAGFGQSPDLDTIPSLRSFDTDSIKSNIPFIKDSLCFITDPENSMVPFINELTDLLNGKDTVINIIHLGDSHIQAGHLSGRTMRLMQNSFGNAGRGWIAPFKLSKLNEPNDYFILSNIKDWVAGRCVQAKPKCPWGIGGIGIQTEAKDVNFNLIIAPNNGAGYSFNKVLLYRDFNTTPMTARNVERDSLETMLWSKENYENISIDTFITKNLIDTFSIKSVNVNMSGGTNKNPNRYYGFMLMNGNPGVLYHAIGVNSARYIDYTNREYVRQLSLLKPSLLIISLGTNESAGRNFNKAVFESQIDAFISLVREEMPGVTLIITTPAEIFKRVYQNKKYQYVRNENVAKAAATITSYTKRKGIACWDFYSISGGDNSCKKWYDAKLFGRDRIHFSRDAYEEQGALLYKALIRSYTSTHENLMAAANTDIEISAIEAETNNTESVTKSEEEKQNVE